MVDRAKIRKFWNGRARQYRSLPFDSIANLEQDEDNLRIKVKHETDKVFSWLGDIAGRSVLDLGAGVGSWAFRCAERGARRIVAVEYSADLIRIGEAERDRLGAKVVTFVESAAESFRSEEQFDLVLCSGLCVYLDDMQFAALASALPNWVAPQGRVLIRDGMGRFGRHEIDDRYSEHLETRYSAVYRQREDYIEAFTHGGLVLVRDDDMFPEGHPLNKYPETRLHLFLFEQRI